MKRCLLALGILLVLLVVFHRPLLRWGVDYAAHHFAAKAGYSLQWDLQGSMVSDLALRKLQVTGPAGGVVTSIRWSDAALEYSLMDLIKMGPGRFLHRLVLKDADVVLDLRKPAPKREPDPSKKKSPLPDFWLENLEIRNVTVRILTPESEMLVKGLTLVLAEGAPGEIALQELSLPKQSLYLTGVQGSTQLQDRWIRFSDLQLMPDLLVRKLGVNIAELKSGKLPLELDLQSGTGSVKSSGSVAGVGQEGGVTLDLDLAVESLRETEIVRWTPLPKGMAWQIDRLTGKVTGPPNQPQKLAANMTLEASAIAVAGVRLDQLRTALTLEAGRLNLQSVNVAAGPNKVDLKGTAVLPPLWNQVARSEASVDLTIAAPAMDQLLPPNTQVQGGLRGTGTVALKDGLLAVANLNLESQDLVVAKVALSDFRADVASDAKTVQVRGITARLNEQNAITLAGAVQLAGRQSADLVLTVDGSDLSTLSQLKDWLDVYPPAGGTLKGTVNARFDVADLKEKNYQRATVEGNLGIDGLQWNQGTLQQAAVEFVFKADMLTVPRFDLTLDDQNKVHLTADLLLRDAQPANVTWDIDLEQIASLTAWIQPESNNTLPPPQSGVLISQGKASFTLTDLKAKKFSQISAGGAINLKELHWLNGLLEDASVDFALADGKMDAPKLSVRFDEDNQISGRATMELAAPNGFTADLKGALKKLPALSGWLELFKGPAIDSGSLAVDWQGSGKLKPLEVTGNGVVGVKDFSLEGHPNTYALDLATRHEGRRAELTKLSAQAGKFRLEAAGAVSDTDLEMGKLLLKSGDTALVEGKVAIPLALTQTPRPKIPIDPDRPIVIDLQMRKLKFEELFAALGQKSPPVSGLAEGTVSLNGRLAELTGKVDLNLQNILASAVKGKLQPASTTVAATLGGGKLQVQAQATQRPLQPLSVRASLPFDPQKVMADPAVLQTTEFQAEVVLPESDLSLVPSFVPALARVEGRVSANVKLDGTVREPHWRGSVNLSIPSADLASTQMSIRDVKARLSFVEKRIAIEDVSAILAGGEIRASGGVDVANLTKPNLNIRVNAKEALIVRDDTMSLRANANVAIVGPLDGASVTGRVELVRGRVFKEIEFLPLSLPNQLPPPPPPVKRSNAKPSAPPPFDKWKLDVAVVTKDPIRLLGNVLNGGVVVNL
ncbi:MAG TPA: translocation/assembly module TamB domain-containing protein, partial [Verrucomicrobium sp.]|nr:translocation/assembly module TamB domain-containing protein [Verrucomicrobium sp.]